MRPLLAWMLFMGLAISPAFADDSATRSAAISGEGRTLCSAWTADRGSADAAAHATDQRARVEWIEGFIGAANVFFDPKGSLGLGKSPQDIAAWTDKYCKAHPGDPIFAAAVNLVLELENQSDKR